MTRTPEQTFPAGHRIRRAEGHAGEHWELDIPGEPALVFGDRQAAEVYAEQVSKERRQAAAGSRIGSS